MASVPSITVSVEQAIHTGLRIAIQEIEKKHGIRVNDICVNWRKHQDETMVGTPPEWRITTINVNSETGER